MVTINASAGQIRLIESKNVQYIKNLYLPESVINVITTNLYMFSYLLGIYVRVIRMYKFVSRLHNHVPCTETIRIGSGKFSNKMSNLFCSFHIHTIRIVYVTYPLLPTLRILINTYVVDRYSCFTPNTIYRVTNTYYNYKKKKYVICT